MIYLTEAVKSKLINTILFYHIIKLIKLNHPTENYHNYYTIIGNILVVLVPVLVGILENGDNYYLDHCSKRFKGNYA